jgi:hypothetical protein
MATVSYAHVKPFGRNTSTGEPACWAYTLHPRHLTTSHGGYKTARAAKSAMTKHIKRGGLSPEWYRRQGLPVPTDCQEKL